MTAPTATLTSITRARRPRRVRPRHWMALVALGLLVGRPAEAHETWLMPPAFRAAAGAPLDVVLTTGSQFPQAEFNTASDDVVYARLRQGDRTTDLTERKTEPKHLALRTPALAARTAVIYALLPPAEVTLSLTQVAQYFDEIAAPARVRSQWASQRRSGATWVESFTKQARTCVQVGTTVDEGCQRAVGLPLEIVPLATPFGLRAGDALRVRLLWQGKPLADTAVGVMTEPSADRRFAVTDAQGVASVPLDRAGRTAVFAVHLRALPAAGQWQSDFTTLTLLVEPRPQ